MPTQNHIKLYFEHVLSWSDASLFKSIATYDPADKRWGGLSTTHLSGLVAMAEWFIQKKRVDTFVLIGSQRSAGAAIQGGKSDWHAITRSADNAVGFQCLVADIDVASAQHMRGYSSRDDAIRAVQKFCVEINLPLPTLWVNSGGGGLHLYWRCEVELPKPQWLQLSHALASAMRLKGLTADTPLTVDANVALRIPTSRNHKYDPGIVRMLAPPAPAIPLADLERALDTFKLTVVSSGAGRGVNDDFGAGIGANVPPVALYDIAEAGCLVMQDAILTEGASHDEPLWSQLLYAATFDPDPEDIAHEISRAYPKYTQEETQSKLDAKLKGRQDNPHWGWPTCQRFSLVSSQCKACPHWGQIKSPFNLVRTNGYGKDDTLHASNAGDLPDGYGRNDAGHIVGYIPKAGSKTGEKVRAVVLPYKVQNAGLSWEDEREVLLFEVEISGEWRLVTLPVASAGSQRDFVSSVGKTGIACPKAMQGHAQEFFLAWVKRLQDMRTRATPHHLGWNGDGFSYGGKLYRQGSTTPVYYSDLPQGYEPTGELDPWLAISRFITSQKRPALDCILVSAFAAPLLKLGLNQSVLLSVWGGESGQGKSLALRVAQAVWGDPTIGINGLDDTKNSLMAKARALRHLPLYWDELKTKDQYDKIVTLVFELGQGKEKSRLGRDSRQMYVGTHQTMLTTVSNHSLFNVVTENTTGTEAGGARVFEVIVPPSALDTSVQTAIWDMNRAIGTNYGRAGEMYAAYLGAHAKAIEGAMTQMAKALSTSLHAVSEERFWISSMSALLVGTSIANTLNLTAIDIRALRNFLEATFHHLRKQMKISVRVMRSKQDGESFLAQLIQNTLGISLLYTDRVLDPGPGRPPKHAVQLVDMDARLRNPWLQLGRDDGVLRIVKHDLKKYVDEQGLNYDEVCTVLTQHFGAVEKRGIGTGIVGHYGALDKARSVCWQITFPSPLSVPASSSGSP